MIISLDKDVRDIAVENAGTSTTSYQKRDERHKELNIKIKEDIAVEVAGSSNNYQNIPSANILTF